MSSDSNNDNRHNSVRQNIENAIEQAEEDRVKRLLNRRLDIARTGLAAYQKGDIPEAVKLFQTYIRILEETKNVGEGELTPALFDIKTELPELMMLSGIYWDLVKVYDYLKSTDSQREFHMYLEKYLIFSKGMPFQALCAESLRKYMNNRKTHHKLAFKNAYEVLGNSQCYIATALVDVISFETLPALQNFRDQFLKKYGIGRMLIRLYYRIGPTLARFTDYFPGFLRRFLGLGLDGVAKLHRMFSS